MLCKQKDCRGTDVDKLKTRQFGLRHDGKCVRMCHGCTVWNGGRCQENICLKNSVKVDRGEEPTRFNQASASNDGSIAMGVCCGCKWDPMGVPSSNQGAADYLMRYSSSLNMCKTIKYKVLEQVVMYKEQCQESYEKCVRYLASIGKMP